MNGVLFEYLDDFCAVYWDDIRVCSEDPLQHSELVEKSFYDFERLVFQRTERNANLVLLGRRALVISLE